MTTSEMIVNAAASAALGAVSGSWGSNFSDASFYDEGIKALKTVYEKGVHPVAKKAAKKAATKLLRQVGKDVLESYAEGFAMAALQKGTAFSVNKGIAYWKDLS